MANKFDFNSTATTTALGGAIGGAPGAAVGFFVGLSVDFLDYVSGNANDKKADALDEAGLLIQAQGDVDTLTTNVGIANTNIQSAQSAISAYESFLDAFPNYADLQKNTFEAQSRSEFKGLLNNYAMGNAYAGASGRVGGSAGLVTAEDQAELVDYAGADMKLGGEAGKDGGRYQMARDETYNNLTMQEQQARDQLGIYQSTLGNINDTLGLYQNALSAAQQRLLDLSTPKTENVPTRGTTGNHHDETGDHRDENESIVLPATDVPLDTAQRKQQMELDARLDKIDIENELKREQTKAKAAADAKAEQDRLDKIDIENELKREQTKAKAAADAKAAQDAANAQAAQDRLDEKELEKEKAERRKKNKDEADAKAAQAKAKAKAAQDRLDEKELEKEKAERRKKNKDGNSGSQNNAGWDRNNR